MGDEKTVDMTSGNPARLIIRFSIPLIIGNLFQQAYTLVDRIIVGQFVGPDGYAAVGATSVLTALFMMLGIGLAIGTGVVVSQYHGAKDEAGTAASIANGAYINVLEGILMTAISIPLIRPILGLLNTPDSLMDDAAAYAIVIMGGLIALCAYNAPFAVLRALGDSKTPLIFLIVCSVLNIGLDLLFVLPLGMGVVGTAIATVIAQAISGIICIIYAYRKLEIVRKAVHHYAKPDRRIIVQILKVGLPTSFQFSVAFIATIVMQRVVNGFGETVIGAFASTTQVELLIQQIYSGLGAAVVTFTGQNMGAGKTDRVRAGMKSSIWTCFFLSVVLLIICWIFGKAIMSIFVKDSDMISISTTGIHITSCFFMMLGVVQVLRFLLNGAGDSMYAMVNGILEVIVRIGFAFALTAIPAIGMWGIWITTGITWLATGLLAIWRYRSGKWKEKGLVSVK